MDREFLPIQLEIRGFLKTFDPQSGKWFDLDQEQPPIPYSEEDQKEIQILAENRLREAIKLKKQELKKMQVSQLMKTLQIAEVKKEQKGLQLKLSLKGLSKTEIEKEKVVEDGKRETKLDLERSRDASELAYEDELLDQ